MQTREKSVVFPGRKNSCIFTVTGVLFYPCILWHTWALTSPESNCVIVTTNCGVFFFAHMQTVTSCLDLTHVWGLFMLSFLIWDHAAYCLLASQAGNVAYRMLILEGFVTAFWTSLEIQLLWEDESACLIEGMHINYLTWLWKKVPSEIFLLLLSLFTADLFIVSV